MSEIAPTASAPPPGVVDDTAQPAPPPPQRDRIRLLDAARGLAILGILPCNMPDFAYPLPVSELVRAWPHGTGWATLAGWASTQIAFQRKFVSLFSMMFGVSVFLVGGERGDGVRSSIIRKRLSWLLVIGLVHCFAIWWGDVLVTYALGGAILYFVRSWPPRRLLTLGLGLWLAFCALYAVGVLFQVGAPPSDVSKSLAEGAKAIGAYRTGFLGSLIANARDGLFAQSGQPVIVPSLFGLMCVGLAAYKWGVFTGEAPRSVYWALMGAGLLALAVVAMTYAVVLRSDLSRPAMALAGWTQQSIAPLTSLAYVSILFFALSSRLWRFIPDALAPVGQMAFTNYLTQSLMMTAVFYGGRGPNLYGTVDRPGLWAICIAVWVLQIIWSRLWLTYFTMGPLEWCWRRLYRGPAPLRRSPGVSLAAA